MRRNECLDLAEIDPTSLSLPLRGERLVRDVVQPNLGLRLRASGARTWVVFATKGGRTTRRTLGDALSIPVSSARIIADPGGRNFSPPGRCTTPELENLTPGCTVADALPRYIKFGAVARWKASTGQQMARVGRLYILPFLGARRIRDLGKQEVASWYAEIQLLSTSSRMALSTLSGLMRYAEDHGLRKPGSNPCQGLRKKERSGRGRLVPDRDIQLLWQTLTRHENEMLDACDAIRLLLLTGARKREILNLRWDQIAGSRAVLTDSKTGPRTIWLNSPACAILATRRKVAAGEWVALRSPSAGAVVRSTISFILPIVPDVRVVAQRGFVPFASSWRHDEGGRLLFDERHTGAMPRWNDGFGTYLFRPANRTTVDFPRSTIRKPPFCYGAKASLSNQRE